MRRRLFAIAILVLGATAIAGCGKTESKYVGKYVSGQDQSVLELKSDGTFTYESKTPVGIGGDYRTGFIPKYKTNVETGKWALKKWEGRETIEFTPYNHRLKYLVKTNDGNLAQPMTGETFVKQSRVDKPAEILPPPAPASKSPAEVSAPAPAQPAEAPPLPAPAPKRPAEISAPASPLMDKQTWSGYYACGQGKTSLILIINSVLEVKNTDTLKVEAIFDFNYANGRAVGKYKLYGQYNPKNRSFLLNPGDWIQQPSGYETVGMDGKISSDGKHYTGKILNPGCHEFDLSLDE